MPDMVTLNLAKSYANQLVGIGITNVQYVVPNTLKFTLANNTTQNIVIPSLHTHSNLNTILEKISLDSSNNLLFDGQPINETIDLTSYLKTIDADNKYEPKNSAIVKDSSYVHTDNNYTNADKLKLQSITSGQQLYTVGIGGVIQYTVGYISNADTIMTASSNNITHCNRVVGIITESKSQGEQVKIQNQGELINTSWNLISGDSYYLGLGGNITNVVPTTGFIQKVGIAKNSTTLMINLCQPIKLI